MLLLVGLASIFIAVVTVRQYKKQTKEYYDSRFERKETAAQKNVNFELENTIYPAYQQFLGPIFRERIYEIATVHDMKMSIYDLNGNLKINSFDPWFRVFKDRMAIQVLENLKEKDEYKESVNLESGKISQSSYSYIHDRNMNKIGILKIEYIQDNSQEEEELTSFLNRLFVVYAIMLLLAVAFAYFLSSYITRSLKSISDKIQETKLLQNNQKIDTKDSTPEIASIVDAYNQMIDELEESAEKLAKSEREQAWREMAKQVAHEIKNPLTPMKLTVQSFERNFDPNAEGIREKVKDYSLMLTQQIDVMSSIATSFSDFARMPKKTIERVDLVRTIKSAIDIFYEEDIAFNSEQEEIYLNVDKNQITRVVNNLVKNATQATENIEEPKIEVSLKETDKEVVLIIKDNGKGIEEDDKELIFEPKFTTKTSGMGLGLPMVKNIVETYNGEVVFNSVVGLGTEFIITFPK
ncbi:histidine kinase [Wenyingzhuangia fucanilytica]|uniref:histidine kinase n=2 Tax=Wenyingzhuangia fucanilytica TaxID=1790137 RepID=A0A1B1Y2F3_9FLAO|nr:histidine kinase [Wenyingzhuangia fucanilytica]